MTQDKLNSANAAKYLGMSVPSLYRKVQHGEISHERYLNKLLFTKESLNDYIVRNTKRFEF